MNLLNRSRPLAVVLPPTRLEATGREIDASTMKRAAQSKRRNGSAIAVICSMSLTAPGALVVRDGRVAKPPERANRKKTGRVLGICVLSMVAIDTNKLIATVCVALTIENRLLAIQLAVTAVKMRHAILPQL